MLKLEVPVLDKKGQPYMNFNKRPKVVEVPEGAWVAAWDYVANKNLTLDGPLPYIHGVERESLQYFRTKYFENHSLEGYVTHWGYSFVGIEPFVISYGDSFSVAQQVQGGQLVWPKPFRMKFVRGTRRWRWVNLDQVLQGLRLTKVTDIAPAVWDLVGKLDHLICDPHDRHSDIPYRYIEAVLGSPDQEVEQLVTPDMCSYFLEEDDEYFLKMLDKRDPKQVWISAGLARDLVQLATLIKPQFFDHSDALENLASESR